MPAGMTSPTSIKIGPMGNFNPLVPMFSPGGQGEANKILGAYGLQMPQISPDQVFQNQGPNEDNFHRLMSAAILGAAFTRPGMTAGESISNVAQGVLGGQELVRQRALQQFMAPFNVANTLSEVQGRQAQEKYLEGIGHYYNARGSNQKEVMGIHQTVDGKMFRVMNDGSSEWLKDPEGNVMVGPPTNSQRPAAQHSPGGFWGNTIDMLMGPPPDGSDPQAVADYASRRAMLMIHFNNQQAGGRTAAGLTARDNDPNFNPREQLTLKTRIKTADDDIKATQKELSTLTTKHAYSAKAQIGNLQQELQKKSAAFDQYVRALASGQDVDWNDFLNSGNQQPNAPGAAPAPAQKNPFRR